MRSFSIAESDNTYTELGAPLKIYYDIINSCNLDCVFCYKDKTVKNVSWEDAKSVIQKIADANIPDIVFIGGEPLCCPFLFDALSFSKSVGLNPGIVTNGTLFTREIVELIKPLVNNSISVSVHASNDDDLDKITQGQNTYTKVLAGLRLLNEQNIIPELSFTPIKANVHTLYETIDGILSEGIIISDLLVNRLIPFGNAITDWSDKKIDLSDQVLLFEQMDRLQKKYPNLQIASGDALPFCMVDEKYWKYIARCDYAITLGWINEKHLFGRCMVRGCTTADSIDTRDIRDLWSNSDTFLCHRRKKNLNEVCRECEWLNECGGGCSCSGEGSTNKDAYLDESKMHTLPPHHRIELQNEIITMEVTSMDLGSMKDDSVTELIPDFIIRKEHPKKDSEDSNYLFIPKSSGAIICDTIIPESGEILWLNEIEKQIIIYMKAPIRVFDMVKRISYEFNLPWNQAVNWVKSTVFRLQKLGMVKIDE